MEKPDKELFDKVVKISQARGFVFNASSIWEASDFKSSNSSLTIFFNSSSTISSPALSYSVGRFFFL